MAEELLLDRYRLIETAGKGGYGTVHRAYDTRLKREVAIKTIELSPEDAERTRLAEARAKSGSGANPDASSEGGGSRHRKPLDPTADEEPPRRKVKPLVEFDHPEVDMDFPGDPGFLSARDDRESMRRRGQGNREGAYGYDDYGDYGVYDGYDDYGYGYDDYGYGPDNGYDDYGYDDPYGDYDYSAYGTSRYSTRLETARSAQNPATMVIGRAISSAKTVVTRGAAIPEEAEEEEDPLAHIPGLEEARTAANLKDDNIVTVYDCEVHDGYAYIIMEYVEGKTLTEVLHELGDNITLDMVGAVFGAVSNALKKAHKKKVLHLDIKPDNVIIDKEGAVKVTDFGLAKLADSAGHATTGGGTIGYMPLEQMRLQPLDVRTDEWALASLTYEMLVGVNPFFAPDLATAEKAIEGAELILPSSRWDDLTPEIDDPVFKALSPDPEERYESVNAFAVVVKPQLGSTKKGKKELAEVVAGSPDAGSVDLTASSALISPGENTHASQAFAAGAGAGGAGAGGSGAGAKAGALGAAGNGAAGTKAGVVGAAGANGATAGTGAAGSDVGSGAGSGATGAGSAGSGGSVFSRIARRRKEKDAEAAAASAALTATNADSADQKESRRSRFVSEIPLVDRIGPVGGTLVMRVISALACLLIAVFALMNIHATPDSPLGLASNSWPIFIALIVGSVAVAALRPGIGALVVFEMVAVAVFSNGAYFLGLIIAILTALWWWYFAKDDVAQAFSVLCTPLFGTIGFGAVGPILAGSLLTVGRAAVSAFFSVFIALVLAAISSADLMNWTVFSSWDFANIPMEESLIKVALMPQTWFTAVSWMGAAVSYSLACARGSRRFDISGAVIAAAFLIAGVSLSSGFTDPGEMWALGPMSFIGALFPGVLGVLLAYLGVSDRARWDVDEWEEFRDTL